MTNQIALPSKNDPRWTVLLLLSCYIVLGMTVLGFNRSPQQVGIIILSACLLDLLLNFILNRKLHFPLSAVITGCGLSILVNYAHGIFIPLVPVFFAISSKYLITAQNRHVFNPALFGVVAGLLLGGDMITPAPSYQWGGGLTIAAFIVTAAVLLFVKKINRTTLILSFVGLYTVQLAIRALLLPDLIPANMLFFGAFANPAFYLFTFFMITDPVTSPQSKKGQFIMALIIVVIDLALHKMQSYGTLFFAGFIYFILRWLWMHAVHFKLSSLSRKLVLSIRNIAVVGCIGFISFIYYQSYIKPIQVISPGFYLTQIDSNAAGISTNPSKILEQTDPKIQHIAKWLLSVGDAVAVADANNDGFVDIFLTYTLKQSTDRAALYLNQGDFTFKRFPIPLLTELYATPKQHGLPSGALWLDYDNDSDSDLLVLGGYGKSLLLKNLLSETGQLAFTDVSTENGLTKHTISLTANAFDMNQDGLLDLLIGNAIPTHFPDYDTPTPVNLFTLPNPAYKGDRRMFNIMHRTWHNANNGGKNYLFINKGKHFEELTSAISGLDGTRWTLDIGTGDFNDDGLTDLYLANDFGPDELLINQQGQRFKRVQGHFAHQIGRDVYKSMNASVADFDGNGFQDIYTSNVHHKLQAEGSQLWLNDGQVNHKNYYAFKDSAFGLNALNEHRFGWGAAVGDINLDGLMDIVQANGMVNNDYDPLYNGCPDYWYWNEKIALTGPDEHGYADNWADLRGRCIFPDELDRIYLNQGKHFIDVASQVNLTHRGNSRGVALADLDNDGDHDLLITDQFGPVAIYKNELKEKTWIGLQLVGNSKTCNRDALGTKVELANQRHEIRASNGFSSQSDSRLLVGLNHTDKELVSVIINWCDSNQTKTYQLAKNQYHIVKQ